MGGTDLIKPATPEAIAEAADAIRRGDLVAFPTETVYGLGADATNDRAVARIFEAKGRPHFNPLIVHVATLEAARVHADFDTLAEQLAARFWPGPFTLVLPRAGGTTLSLLVSAGLDTVALRVPGHPIARTLLDACDLPVAAPSANPSGGVSPTTAAHVAEGLGDKLALILDGGPCRVGLESTVVAIEGGRPVILRPGGVTRAMIEAVAGPVASAGGGGALRSPGMLESHYAPALPLRLEATDVAGDEALLAFGPRAPEGGKARCNLSPSGDLIEAASNLFAMLRTLDKSGARAIAVMPVPEEGLGEAINDRLRRAAAPRVG